MYKVYTQGRLAADNRNTITSTILPPSMLRTWQTPAGAHHISCGEAVCGMHVAHLHIKGVKAMSRSMVPIDSYNCILNWGT